MLAMSRGQNLKGAIVSYNGTLVITFTSILEDRSIQKKFFRLIAGDGVEVAVETNDIDDEEEDDTVSEDDSSSETKITDKDTETEDEDEQMS